MLHTSVYILIPQVVYGTITFILVYSDTNVTSIKFMITREYLTVKKRENNTMSGNNIGS